MESKKKIDGGLFKRLLRIKDPEYKILVGQNFDKNFDNIQLLSIDDITDKWDLTLPENEHVLVVQNVVVSETLQFERLQFPLLFIDCEFESIRFLTANKTQAQFLKRIHFSKSTVNNFLLNNCLFKNFIIDCKTEIKNFSIQDTSIKSLEINNVVINVFSLKKVTIGLSCQLLTCKVGEMEVEESEFNDLAFNNTCIQRNLSITDSKANQLVVIKSVVKGIWHNVSNQIKTLALSQNSKFSLIDISNQCNIQEFFLTNVKLDKFETKQNCTFGEIKLDSSTVFNDFSCSDNVAISELLILSSFLGEAGFDLTKIGKLNFENSYAGHLFLKNSEIEDFLADDATKTGDIVFEKCQIDFLNLVEHFGPLTFTGSKIKLGRIDNSSIHRFDISMGSEFEMYLKGCQVNWLSFSQTTISKDSLLSISDGSVYCIEMDEFTVHGDLHFRKIGKQDNCFDWWWKESDEIIKDFPEGYFAVVQDLKHDYDNSVKELKESFNEPIIRISHSTLGKTEFTNCPLNEFRLEFNNSKIIDCFITGGTVPAEKIIIINDADSELGSGEIVTHSQKASIYNQFKKIFEAQGDVYRAAQFQAKWAEHQKKYLQLEYVTQKKKSNMFNPWERLTLLFSELSQDLGIFRLNRWSNNHGESWLLALAFTIITTGIFYLIFLWTIGRIYYIHEFDWNLIGYYFEYITPSFNPDFITGYRPSPGSIILYYLGKAVFAYGLYQFIAAFRKHGRKK